MVISTLYECTLMGSGAKRVLDDIKNIKSSLTCLGQVSKYTGISKRYKYVRRIYTYSHYSDLEIKYKSETLKTIDDIYHNNDISFMNDITEDNIPDEYKRKIKERIGDTEMNLNTELCKMKNKMTKDLINKVKNSMGMTLKLCFTDEQYMRFLSWLKKYDKNFKNHIIKHNKFGNRNMYKLKDCDFIIKINNHTFARIFTETAIANAFTDVDIFSNHCYIPNNAVHIYLFGRDCKKVAKTLNDISNENYTIGCYKVVTNSERRTPTIYHDDLNHRRKNSVFLNNNIKEKILKHVDMFFSNKDVYEKRNLTYKTGILLYGEPGTGKTTISNMIASEYDCDIVLINMSEFINLDIDFLTTTINADDKTYIILLEDIDCVIGDRESEEDDLENKKNVNKLLQFLDSTSSPDNVIFVATTNHIDKLDDAILRDGRFDLIVNITDLNKEAAMEMCKSFNLSTANTNKLLSENMKDGKINPAKLQNLILQKMEPLNN